MSLTLAVILASAVTIAVVWTGICLPLPTNRQHSSPRLAWRMPGSPTSAFYYPPGVPPLAFPHHRVSVDPTDLAVEPFFYVDEHNNMCYEDRGVVIRGVHRPTVAVTA